MNVNAANDTDGEPAQVVSERIPTSGDGEHVSSEDAVAAAGDGALDRPLSSVTHDFLFMGVAPWPSQYWHAYGNGLWLCSFFLRQSAAEFCRVQLVKGSQAPDLEETTDLPTLRVWWRRGWSAPSLPGCSPAPLAWHCIE